MSLTAETYVRELANEARDALLDKLSTEIFEHKRDAIKTRRYNKALDKLAEALDVTRQDAEKWLTGTNLRSVK